MPVISSILGKVGTNLNIENSNNKTAPLHPAEIASALLCLAKTIEGDCFVDFGSSQCQGTVSREPRLSSLGSLNRPLLESERAIPTRLQIHST